MLLGALAGLFSGFFGRTDENSRFCGNSGWMAGYRGALQLVTMSKGTIVITNGAYNAIGNGYNP